MDELKQVMIENKGIFKNIFGCENVKKDIRSAILMNRHIVIIGPPGVGKTTLAKDIAGLMPEITVNDCSFNCIPDSPACPLCLTQKTEIKTKTIKGLQRFIRLQGSPDLMVEDIIGDIDPVKALKYGPSSIEAFTPGKIFKANKGILFFDELNRCPEKLQNSLLQVLEEGIVTIGGYDIDIKADFLFIGTMNPDDFAGTEKISEVLLDRFDLVYMSYPKSLEIEKKIVKEKGKSLEVYFDDALLDIALIFIRRLRESDKLDKFPSLRASIGIYERAQANAVLALRNKVIFDDIVSSFKSVLAHRIRLKPSQRYLKTPSEFIKDELAAYTKTKDLDYNMGYDKESNDSGSSEGDLP